MWPKILKKYGIVFLAVASAGRESGADAAAQSQTCVSGQPTIAVLDTAVDLNVDSLRDLLDTEGLAQEQFFNKDGELRPLAALHAEQVAATRQLLDETMAEKQINLFRWIADPLQDDVSPTSAVKEALGASLPILGRKAVRHASMLGGYMHGTHVTSSIADEIANLNVLRAPDSGYKLLPVPLLTQDDTWLSRGSVDSLEAEFEQMIDWFRSALDRLDIIFSNRCVRVANLSLGADMITMLREIKITSELGTFWFGNGKRIKELYEPVLVEMRELIHAFMRKRSDVVFVLAAGNEGREVNDLHVNWPVNELENVVVVAMSNNSRSSKRVDVHPLSSYSHEYVDVAAPFNQRAQVPLTGLGSYSGSRIAMPGSSMAAPRFLGRSLLLAQVELEVGKQKESLLDLHEQSAEELKDTMLDQTWVADGLCTKIKGCRFLGTSPIKEFAIAGLVEQKKEELDAEREP